MCFFKRGAWYYLFSSPLFILLIGENQDGRNIFYHDRVFYVGIG